jgi:phage repressor protein C with HTH and peptisase S24 domain
VRPRALQPAHDTPIRARLAAEMLREGHTVDLPALGTSMRPLITPGGVIRVAPASAGGVRPGDVVLVDAGGHLVCHRLVYATAARVVTRGDNAPACDPPLPADAVIGRVEVPPSPHALYCAVRALFR